MNEEVLVERKDEREKCYDRIEVLNQVGELLLIPNNEYATMNMVAKYYKVPMNTIDYEVNNNLSELLSNGYKVVSGSEIAESHVILFDKFTKNRANYKFVLDDENSISVGGRGIRLFSKRAILNIGMLLRDSEVAKEVRRRLLDIIYDAEKNTNIVEEIVKEIRTEQDILNDIMKALMDGDLQKESLLKTELIGLRNKRIEALEKENIILEEKVDSLQNVIRSVGAFFDKDEYYTIDEFVRASKFVYEGKHMGKNSYLRYLRDVEILMKGMLPYQKYMKYFKVVPYYIKNVKKEKLLVNGMGVKWLLRKAYDHGILPNKMSRMEINDIIENLKGMNPIR